MPYRRKTSTTRKPKRRYTTRKRGVSTAVKKYVRRAMPKVELKQSWTHTNEIALNTLTQGYQTNGPSMAQGTGASNRIGNVINAKALHIKGVLNNNSGSESMARCIVIGYDASNGDPTLNLFRNGSTGATSGISGINGLDAMYYPVNKLDFHIYYDKVIRVAGSAAGNAGANVKLFSHFVKFHGRKIEFKANTSGFGNQTWMYSIIWIAADSNDDTTTGTTMDLSMLERFYYTDA